MTSEVTTMTLEEKAHRISVTLVAILLLSLLFLPPKPQKIFVYEEPAELGCPRGWFKVQWMVPPGQEAPSFNCVPPFPRD